MKYTVISFIKLFKMIGCPHTFWPYIVFPRSYWSWKQWTWWQCMMWCFYWIWNSAQVCQKGTWFLHHRRTERNGLFSFKEKFSNIKSLWPDSTLQCMDIVAIVKRPIIGSPRCPSNACVHKPKIKLIPVQTVNYGVIH